MCLQIFAWRKKFGEIDPLGAFINDVTKTELSKTSGSQKIDITVNINAIKLDLKR